MNKVECLRRMVEKISGKKGKGTTVTECLKELAVALGKTISGDDICELLHQLGDIAPDVIGGGGDENKDAERIRLNALAITSLEKMFYDNQKLVEIKGISNSSNITHMSNTFAGCTNLETIALFDTSRVDTMESTFANTSKLKTIPNFNFTSVNWAKNLFSYSGIETIAYINMPSMNYYGAEKMFYYCSKLKSLDSITFGSEPIYLTDVFAGCSNLVNAPIIYASQVETMIRTFSGCSKLVDTPELDVQFVTDFTQCFKNCKALKTVKLFNISANIDFSASTVFEREDIINIFNNLASVGGKTLTLGETNLAKVTDEDKAIATNKGWTLA